MKEHIRDALSAMGATIVSESVNRLDYAVDIATPYFELDMKNFVAPRKAKVRPFYQHV